MHAESPIISPLMESLNVLNYISWYVETVLNCFLSMVGGFFYVKATLVNVAKD